MAYEIRPQKSSDEEENPPLTNAPAPEITQGPPSISGPSYAPRANNDPSYTPSSQGVPGSKFVNFDRILNANKDTAEASASNLTGHLQSQATNAQNAFTGGKADFDNGVAAGSKLTGVARPGTQSVAPTGDMFNAAGGTLAGAPPQRPAMDQSFLPPDQRSPAQHVLPGTMERTDKVDYTGPDDITKSPGWADMIGQASKSDADLAAASSPGGLGALAKQQAGGQADYTAGMQGMDAALLGGVAGGRFDELSKKYGGLGKLIDKGAAESNANAATARGKVDAHNKRIDDANTAAANKAAETPTGPVKSEYEKALDAEAAANPDLNKEKGKWGQVDVGSFGSPGPNSTTDAGKFDYWARRSGVIDGMTEDQVHALYDKLTPAEMHELSWVIAGPSSDAQGLFGTGGPAYQTAGFSAVHPYYAHEAQPGTDAKTQTTAAIKDYFARMRKKYGI